MAAASTSQPENWLGLARSAIHRKVRPQPHPQSRTRRQEKRPPPTAATPASSSSAHRFPTSKNSLTSRLFDTLNRSCSGGKGRLPSITVLICLRYDLGSYFGNSPSVLAIAKPVRDFGGSRGAGSKKPSPYISMKYLRRIRSRSGGP